MPYYMGAFLAVALKWRTQARNAIKGREALRKLSQEVGALKEEKQNWGLKEEASQSFARIIPASFTSLGGPVFSGKVSRQCPRPWSGSPSGAVSSAGCL